MEKPADRVLKYLQLIYPEGLTNARISRALNLYPHQLVFAITRQLMREKKIHGRQGQEREREWTFYAPPPEEPPPGRPAEESDPGEDEKNGRLADAFEGFARKVLSRHFGQPLPAGRVPGIPKRFDFVSPDGSIVGDAKFYALVGGKGRPPAKWATIAEYVWLLEKTGARHRFLVFGNDRRVPVEWLKLHGHLVKDVEFYFLDEGGELEQIN